MSLPALRLIGKGRVTTGPTAAECSGQAPLAVRATAGISGRLDNPKGTGKGGEFEIALLFFFHIFFQLSY